MRKKKLAVDHETLERVSKVKPSRLHLQEHKRREMQAKAVIDAGMPSYPEREMRDAYAEYLIEKPHQSPLLSYEQFKVEGYKCD
jgi:hypothetical protein